MESEDNKVGQVLTLPELMWEITLDKKYIAVAYFTEDCGRKIKLFSFSG